MRRRFWTQSAGDEPRPQALDVAIVGMSCLMPGAKNLAEFWERILAAKDSIVEIPANRFDWRRRYDATGRKSDHIRSRWGGFLDDVAFDPLKYGIPPASIPSIEPMQLLALELVDAALRDSGRDDLSSLRQRTSVVLGIGGGLAELGNKYVVRSSLARICRRSGGGAEPAAARMDGRQLRWHLAQRSGRPRGRSLRLGRDEPDG